MATINWGKHMATINWVDLGPRRECWSSNWHWVAIGPSATLLGQTYDNNQLGKLGPQIGIMVWQLALLGGNWPPCSGKHLQLAPSRANIWQPGLLAQTLANTSFLHSHLQKGVGEKNCSKFGLLKNRRSWVAATFGSKVFEFLF